jgi:thioredoxin reductase
MSVAVIGAGPAGIAAAVQLRRHGIEPIVYERGDPGGLLREAWLVENYPGFPRGIAGAELADLMAEQLRRTGVDLMSEEVTSLERAGQVLTDGPGRRGAETGTAAEAAGFVLTTPKGSRRFAAVIAASGTSPRCDHGIPIEESVRRRVLRGVRALRDVTHRRIAVVGGGDAAFDYAVGLAGRNAVTILVRSETSACIPLLAERVAACDIDIRHRTEVRSIEEGATDALRLVCDSGGSELELDCDYAVLAVGREPGLEFLGRELMRAVGREVGVEPRGGSPHTSDAVTPGTPRARDAMSGLDRGGGLFLAGDVVSGRCRQTAIAVGQGVMCAMKAAALLR